MRLGTSPVPSRMTLGPEMGTAFYDSSPLSLMQPDDSQAPGGMPLPAGSAEVAHDDPGETGEAGAVGRNDDTTGAERRGGDDQVVRAPRTA